MDIINTSDLVFEYITRDEEDRIEDRVRAIDGISLNIKEGEFVAVLGRNGSGKSTLAKQFNAILLPTEGTVSVYGMDTADENNTIAIREKVGMVFQNPDNQIIANIVEEDVGFGPENIGVPTEEIWERVNEALRSVGMEEHRMESPGKLSGGQKQRVAIAGVMAMKPKCIVLDESTAMLDPLGRKDVLDTAVKLNREDGMAVVIITHYMEEAVLADRVVVVDKGRIVMEGTPREVFSQNERLESLGLDVPQVTKLTDELRKEGIDLPDGILTVDEFAERFMEIYKKGGK